MGCCLRQRCVGQARRLQDWATSSAAASPGLGTGCRRGQVWACNWELWTGLDGVEGGECCLGVKAHVLLLLLGGGTLIVLLSRRRTGRGGASAARAPPSVWDSAPVHEKLLQGFVKRLPANPFQTLSQVVDVFCVSIILLDGAPSNLARHWVEGSWQLSKSARSFQLIDDNDIHPPSSSMIAIPQP